ncbi:MAG: hypothetical protein IT560_11165 [Alphaproteobacteria bacterium]|nr:hypothetical protein [Alphaproteobacteria bacterium]
MMSKTGPTSAPCTLDRRAVFDAATARYPKRGFGYGLPAKDRKMAA